VLTDHPKQDLMLDPEILQYGLLKIFRRLIFAHGELGFPCVLEWVDDYMHLIRGLLRAFRQNPPDEEVEVWRKLVVSKLEKAKELDTPSQLVIRYEPFFPSVGLTGGFRLGIRLEEMDPVLAERVAHCSSFQEVMTLHGSVKFPCVPSFTEQSLTLLKDIMTALQQDISQEELQGWREVLQPKMERWFHTSGSAVLIHYELFEPSLGLPGGITLRVTQRISTIEEHYQAWVKNRKGSLFGTHPDAKVVAVAEHLKESHPIADIKILDVGAGTGRNSIGLARMGYKVDALEITQVLTDKMNAEIQASHLSVETILGDIMDPALELPSAAYNFIFLSEVVASHFQSTVQVRQLLERVLDRLEMGGYLLFNAFLAAEEYEPDRVVRELSQVYWSFVMTRPELTSVLEGLPFDFCSDESAHDYEKQHLPPEAWPPTSWFINWSTGRNLFPIRSTPPVELRWILLQKRYLSE
jgi:SAM-dependent methyltransferase